MMDQFGNAISVFDYVASSKRTRHITGGLLLSLSLFFGGLALTILTSKSDEENIYHE